MNRIWKVLIGLALVVPMVAYVAGSLVASAADDPAQRDTIQIRKTEPTSTATPTSRPTKTPSDKPDSTPSESDDDDVEVINPDYDDFDDHDDHGDDDGDDHSGPGGGDDHGDDHEDNSGPGGGDDHDDDSGPGGD